MRIIQVGLGKARVWLDERAMVGFGADGVLSRVVPSGPLSSIDRRTAGVEVLIPRGAYAEYGLIGVAYAPNRTSDLCCEVPFSTGMTGKAFPQSLANALDDVRLGLPEEYAAAVMASLGDGVAGRLSPGLVRVVDAAHGMAGSSPELFKGLTNVAVELVLLGAVVTTDETMIGIIRPVLLG